MRTPWAKTRAAAWVFAAPAMVAMAVSACSHREPAGGPIQVTVCFGEVGLSPGQFSYPRCLDHDTTSLWAIDKQARVQRLDQTGRPLGGWQMPEWSNGKPTGVTVWEPEGEGDGPLVFIPDTHYSRVMVYDGGARAEGGGGAATLNRSSMGTLLTRFGENGTGAGQLIWPTDVAVLPTPDGKAIARLYVSEYSGNDRITVWEPDVPLTKQALLAMMAPDGAAASAALTRSEAQGGNGAASKSVARSVARIPECPFRYKYSFGHYGSGESADDVQFNRPQSMAIDQERRELIVTDACNHRLGRFTLEGKLIAWISGPDQTGPEPGHFMYPYGLCLLEDGSALVAEFGANRVQHVDLPSGTSLGLYGQPGRGEGQLASPWGIAVIGKTAYVLDSGNNRVMGFEVRSRKTERGARNVSSTPSPGGPEGGHG